jgi:hypothetical protein
MSLPDDHRLTQAARDGAVAAILLSLANALAVKVGTDGVDVITVAKATVPIEVGLWIHTELCKHKHAVIAIIEADVAARRGELVPAAVEAEEV